MAYGDFKDLTRRTVSAKILRDKAFNIAKIQNIMDINVDLHKWSINFLMKKLQLVPVPLQINLLQMKICHTKMLAQELHKQIITKFKKKKTTLIFYRQYLGC